MRWEIEVVPKSDPVSRVYLIEGDLDEQAVRRIAAELLTDPVTETFEIQPTVPPRVLTIIPKPGVMDPAAESVETAIRDMGYPPVRVCTGRRFRKQPQEGAAIILGQFWLPAVKEVVEQAILGGVPDCVWLVEPDTPPFHLVRVPLLQADDAELQRISRQGQLSLSLEEMRAIQEHFRSLGRDPTDIELETLAQTWSEHCSHKTLKGTIVDAASGRVLYRSLLKETIFYATQEIRRQLGPDDWCVSVFVDNAGIVRFDENHHVCFKVETHNHPSAIEPYGGANTGLGGVIRDVLGTGLGGKPICNTDVFCFAPPDHPETQWPTIIPKPRFTQREVVAGVRDYGNRMGIPTVNGAICYDERYLTNPLVFCGTVGLVPVGKEFKSAQPGDLIVVVGGRTGRDGIHGATFSSAELTHQSSQLSGGAVQIGNAITEKKLLDVLLQARDRGLYHAITDCGAGGFSSAIGEMGAELGAEVHLERAPLKYAGLTYCEIWISEAQERMVLAVPPERWSELKALCDSENVEATVLGTFRDSGKLALFYDGVQVADLEMRFLHDGRPAIVRQARLPHKTPPGPVAHPSASPGHASVNHNQTLLRLLGAWNVCSKEAVIRQYDHEVQGGTVIKPLVGATMDGPGDAAVLTPVLGSMRGIAVGCGINPRYGGVDPYWMAASVVDEACRNVVAVGADPARIALLDNFCWGNPEEPDTLGALVRAAEACRDVALAYKTPFISGKDSLYNEYHSGFRKLAIPPTLLVSALGHVADVRRCVTMDLKQPGNYLFLVGITHAELGGSHFHLIMKHYGGIVPRLDFNRAPRVFHAIHQAIQHGWLRACHDLSEGGLAVALAEMAFAGDFGAIAFLEAVPLGEEVQRLPSGQRPIIALYSESNTRFLCEVPPEHAAEFEDLLEQQGIPYGQIGYVIPEGRLQVYEREEPKHDRLIDLPLKELKEAWQRPLREL